MILCVDIISPCLRNGHPVSYSLQLVLLILFSRCLLVKGQALIHSRKKKPINLHICKLHIVRVSVLKPQVADVGDRLGVKKQPMRTFFPKSTATCKSDCLLLTELTVMGFGD